MSDEVVISLGVADIERAKQFFCEGLDFEIERSAGPFAAFKESRGAPVALYTGAPLAYDAGLVADSVGHRGVTLSYLVDTPARVDELMGQAERAGATIIEPPHTADWGGYIGYLTDPDGNLWKVVVRQSG
jgi:uncharacterized protein